MRTVYGTHICEGRRNPLAQALALALSLGAGSSESIGPIQPTYASSGRSEISGSTTATPLSVFNCTDDGPGSLRAAVSSAVSGATIDLSQLDCSTISLTTGAITVGVDSLTLRGRGLHALNINRASVNKFAI